MNHPAPEFSLFVGDLPLDCSDDKLQRLFQQKFKSVKRVQIIRNEDGSSRGFGFIRFEDRSDFQSALTQEMKIGNTTLRLDTAHSRENRYNKNRSRYNSFNSTGNISNHHNHHHHFNNSSHNHHHNQHHHNHPNQHHGSQQHHQNPNNNNNNNNSKNLQPDHSSGGGVGIGVGGVVNSGSQHHHQMNARPHNSSSTGPGGSTSSLNPIGISSSGSSSSNISHHHPVHHHQQQQQPQHSHLNTHPNHSHFGNSQQQPQSPQQQPNASSNQNQMLEANKNVKQPTQFGVDSTPNSQPVQNPTSSQNSLSSQPPSTVPTQTLPQNSTQQSLLQVSNTAVVANATSASNSVNHTNAIHNHNLNANQQAIGPDLRGFTGATTMMDTHILGATDQPSMMPPTSVYGHLYPYGPPPFGYMHHPPQPNPVIPISAVPPAPPNQASPSAGVNQQQGHSIQATNTQRYSTGQHQHHHHHQSHQGAHAADGTMNTMSGGVQAAHQHQAPPLYYYYPSPLYFDQAGGTTAPPSLYHPQTFHPQFFAMPNPAYMPNAHTFNQHQQQPPTASQSDATVISPQQHQVNLRTRDIDTTIE